MKTKSPTGKSKSLLGSSHGRNIGPMLQKHLGTDYEVTSIFKPDAPLENVVEDVANLGKDLTVIVGGPGNSLDRNYHCSIEKDLNFIARRTDHTNIIFVNLLRRYDKPWMNRKTRNVNLQLDWALLGHGTSHVVVVDTTAIGREEYTAHSLLACI
jgi:hypothetical protein